MAILPKIVNANQLTKNFKQSLKERTGINNFNSDSVARSMYLPFVSELDRINAENRRAFSAIQIDSATGADLDAIAANFGLTRLMPTFSETKFGEKNFLFYCDKTFGTINGGNAITLPKGTKLLLNPKKYSTNMVAYHTTETYTLPANERFFFCNIRSLTAGSSSNVAANSLITHNFTGYSNSHQSSLKCNNTYPILNGRNIESDDSLRYRIVNHYASIIKDSEDSLMLRSLEVPGMLDLEVIPNYYGIGTVGIFVFSSSRLSNAGLLMEVERKLELIKPPGIKFFIMPGVVVHIDLEISLHVSGEVDLLTKNKITGNVSRAITKEISQGNVVGRISTTSLRDIILDSDTDIRGVLAKDGNSNLFRSIYIRRSYGTTDRTSERVALNTSMLTLKPEEYFVAGTVNVDFEVYK